MLQDTDRCFRILTDIDADASRRRLFCRCLENLEQRVKPLNPSLLGTSAQRELGAGDWSGCTAHPAIYRDEPVSLASSDGLLGKPHGECYPSRLFLPGKLY